MTSHCLRAVGLPAVLLAAAVPVVHAQDDTVLVDAAIQLRIARGPSEIVPALVYNGTMLLPVRRFFELAEVRVDAFALGDSLVAVLEPTGLVVRFDPDSAQLRLGDTVVTLDPYDAVWWDGDLFAEPAILERILGVVIRIEWADLSATVERTDGLPVVRRARRERRHALLARPTRPPTLELRALAPAAGGAVVNWSFTGSAGDQRNYYTLDLGVGARVLGGSFAVRPQFWNITGRNGSDFRASWERAWPDRESIRQVRVGDVQSNGRRAQLVRGAVVTNAPFARSSEFDVEQIIGSLPVGWEVELYDRGRLLGYGEVDALGTFQLPLDVRYGQNPFELVMYGPSGEVMSQRRTVRVPFSRLPGGRFEYAAAVGSCRYEPCNALVSADGRYGLTKRITIQGGVDAFALKDGGALWQPYVLASGAVLRSLSLTGEAVLNGHVRGTVEFEPNPDLRLSFGQAAFALSGQEFSTISFEQSRTEATAYWRPGAMRGALYLQAFAARSVTSLFTNTIARVSATAMIRRVRYTLGVRHNGISPDTAPRLGSVTSPVTVDLAGDAILPWQTPWLRGTSVHAEASIATRDGLGAVAARLGRSFRGLARLDLGIGWFRGTGFGLSLGLTTELPGPRVGLRSQTNSQGGTNGLMFVNGSMVYDTDRQSVGWTDGGDLGRAGIAGVLFLDANGNGVRDDGEPGLADIPVQVGGWHAETDATGKFAGWDLLPFESADIVVDSLAFDDPHYVLPAAMVRVRPTPNSFLTVDVPVVVGAEVGGYVLLDGMGLAGIPIVLRELATGAEFFSVTYTDGIFYRTGVPPGEYEVTIRDADMERLGVFVMPLHLFIPPGTDEKRYDDLAIVLERIGG
jgi:hypothetical protein